MSSAYSIYTRMVKKPIQAHSQINAAALAATAANPAAGSLSVR